LFNHLVQSKSGRPQLLLDILDIQGSISSLNSAMLLYWLCYRHDNQISIVIEPGASLIHARMRSAIAGLDEGDFTEGHELERKWRVRPNPHGRLQCGFS
jgi:hypothetical protein